MKQEDLLFTVELYGENLSKPFKAEGRYIAQHHYFEDLKDAFLFLLAIDVRHFDKNYAAETKDKLLFHEASLVHGNDLSTPLSLVRINFDDSPDGMPPPGLYYAIHEDPEVFKTASGVNLESLAFYAYDNPFLMLARIKFDEEYELIIDPGLASFQEQLRSGALQQEYGPPGWNFQVQAKVQHFETGLTKKFEQFTGNWKGTVHAQENYYCHHLRTAFSTLVLVDYYTLDLGLSTERRLGAHIQEIWLTENNDRKLASLSFIGEINNLQRATENGVYLAFHIPIPEFESLTQLDFSRLPHYPQQDRYHQILELTIDRERLVCKEWFKDILTTLGNDSPSKMVWVNQYLEQARYILRIEWDHLPSPDNTIQTAHVPPVEVYPFVLANPALIALKDIGNALFYPDKPVVLGQGVFIKHAGIYDGRDAMPVWTKFLSTPEDQNLPQGVFIRLHEQKISFETLGATLQQFSDIAHSERIQFLVCHGKALPALQQDENEQRRNQEFKPPGKWGHSL